MTMSSLLFALEFMFFNARTGHGFRGPEHNPEMWPDNQLGLEDGAVAATEVSATQPSPPGSPVPSMSESWMGPPVPSETDMSPHHDQPPTPKSPQQQPVEPEPATLLHLDPPSQGALDRRVRRLMQPNAKGEYKVAEDVRRMWNEGKKEQVFKLFAKCDNDPQKFIKEHSITSTKEREMEVGVYFKFVTEEDMKDKSENLCLRCSYSMISLIMALLIETLTMCSW